MSVQETEDTGLQLRREAEYLGWEDGFGDHQDGHSGGTARGGLTVRFSSDPI